MVRVNFARPRSAEQSAAHAVTRLKRSTLVMKRPTDVGAAALGRGFEG